MKGDSQISICEGQLHVAGSSTQGQKKAQTFPPFCCLHLPDPIDFRMLYCQSHSICHFPRERKGSVQLQEARTQLCCWPWGKFEAHLPTRAGRGELLTCSEYPSGAVAAPHCL